MRQPSLSPNLFLASLPPVDFELLRPHLRPVEFVQHDVLFHTGDPVHRVYFAHSGVISIVVDLSGGETIEAAMVGRDGVVGAAAALAGNGSINTAVVQVAGVGSVMGAGELRKHSDERPSLRSALMRNERLVFAQAQQSAACNVTHPLPSRLARWLLRARDLSASDALPLTQEYIAQMLGVRRTSVSVVANTLQQAGLIRYRRGHIQITNVEGLQEAACECYATVKMHYDRLLGQ